MLVTPFGANGEVEHVVDGLGDVEVDTDFPLPVEAGIERRERIRTEGSVDLVSIDVGASGLP